MWTSTFYGNWQYWTNYHKVTFDGPNRIIYVNNLVTDLNVEQDIYSDWKEWSLQSNNFEYPQALSTIGGEPIGGGQYVGSTFFLENGWRIKSWSGDHSLVVDGNLFTREAGEFPFLSVPGYSVNYIMARLQLVQAIEVPVYITSSQGSGSAYTPEQIAQAVWNYNASQSFAPNTFGNYVTTKLLTIAHYLGMK